MSLSNDTKEVVWLLNRILDENPGLPVVLRRDIERALWQASFAHNCVLDYEKEGLL